MARTSAYEAVSNEAHKEARQVARGVLSKCVETEGMDAYELTKRVHAAADDALIYTSDQWAFAWGLPDASDTELSDCAEGFDATLTAKACENLLEYVETSPALDLARELIEAREAHDPDDSETVEALKAATDAAKAFLKDE